MGLVSNRTIVVMLYQVLVTDRPDDELLKTISLPENFLPAFREKVKLYREAMIRVVLRSKCKKETAFDHVLAHYDQLLFEWVLPRNDIAKENAFNAALKDIERLMNPPADEGPFAWGIDWFYQMSPHIMDPVSALSFAQAWKQEYAAFEKEIEGFRRDATQAGPF